ncbi:MAG: RNA polymerase sigma factor [Planctomycetota bacterium]
MDQQSYQLELVRRARRGDKESLGLLAEQARGRLHTYVYRLTQQEELTQEIVQESLFEMCKVLGKLKQDDRFWPWLYGIAVNKLRRHYRTEQTQRRLATGSAEYRDSIRSRRDGLEDLVGDELKHIIAKAMMKLKTRHKAVLVMRCYDDMAYSDIAESMGCSEFSTRMLFLRAKRALQRELSRNGLGKGTLLAALVMFGKMTAPTKAAAAQVSITAGTVKVGLLASVAGLATTKTAILSLTAAGALTAGTIVATSNPSGQAPLDPQTGIEAVTQQINQTPEECWFYYPQGPAGSVMLKVESGQAGEAGFWQVLQNDRANNYYSDNTVQINNHRFYASDLSAMQLPTDEPAMADFLSKVEPNSKPVDRVTAGGRGLLVVASRGGDQQQEAKPWAMRHYNVLDEDFFQADWPTTVGTVDNRDEMHKRGWTYFRVSGQINGARVVGKGRIPFVQFTAERYSPWLKLQVGSLTIVDTEGEAYVQSSSGDQLSLYAGGSFLKGLSRPWMGLHTIDTVRRDAAAQQIAFKTEALPDGLFANVEVSCEGVKLVYSIDLETDVINEITFSTDDGNTGNLRFLYLQSVSGAGQEFIPPRRPIGQVVRKSSPGFAWLAQLMEGSLE